MLMFVLPLFRVIVEPLSMAATLIWFIGVSFVELKFLVRRLPNHTTIFNSQLFIWKSLVSEVRFS